jgi:hypothetical protein
VIGPDQDRRNVAEAAIVKAVKGSDKPLGGEERHLGVVREPSPTVELVNIPAYHGKPITTPDFRD